MEAPSIASREHGHPVEPWCVIDVLAICRASTVGPLSFTFLECKVKVLDPKKTDQDRPPGLRSSLSGPKAPRVDSMLW